LRAAIYTRVSLDRDKSSASPDQQEKACRSLAATRGLEVVEVFVERDVSAFTGKRRPEYDRLLKGFEDGRYQYIIAWELSRLTREGLRGIGTLLDVVGKAGGSVLTVKDSLDSSTPAGEIVFGVMASVAKEESRATSERIKRNHRAAAEAGDWHSGGSRKWGYNADGTIHQEEAEVIREVVRRYLAGESYRQLAIELNARGIRTTTGRTFHASSLAGSLRSPALAGLRQYKEERFPGSWEPILTLDQHAALTAAKKVSVSSRRPYRLLAGLVACGRCGGPMKGMGFVMRNGKSFPRYQCQGNPGGYSGKNCGKVAITENGLHTDVRDRLFEILSSASIRPVSDDPIPALRHQLAEDERALEELTVARFVNRSVDDGPFRRAYDDLTRRLQQTRSALADREREEELASQSLRPGSLEDLQTWWDRASNEDKRGAFRAAVRQVTIAPSGRRGGNWYDKGRVTVEWRWALGIRIAETAGIPEA
jgi:site-specific DNA recombinase